MKTYTNFSVLCANLSKVVDKYGYQKTLRAIQSMYDQDILTENLAVLALAKLNSLRKADGLLPNLILN